MRLGDEWELSPARFALHLPTGTAVAADLHLGYGRVRRRGGDAVPAPSVAEELAPLAGVKRLLVAGDLFEDGRHLREEMEEELLVWLAAQGVALVGVVPGNHDRLGKGSRLPVVEEAMLGEWRIVHGDKALPEGKVVQGHEHPCLRLGASAPCFLMGEKRVVLPAFSQDAAGVNVLGDPRWAALRCAAIVADRVLDFGEVGKIPRRTQT